ncbi:hypothetical protein ACGYLI_16980 [Sulfitobacter sp. 1A13421]|uniref:hypothetical protein n=1 Tax=Sulfitobacter sp. 1A13421 TaxID=3368595 RepID=UPI0037464AFC
MKNILKLAATALLICSPALSAELNLKKYHNKTIVHLSGPIELGDAEEFRGIMKAAILEPGIERLVVSLDSPGGNVHEAIEIGKTVRKVLAETWTTSTEVWTHNLKREVQGTLIPGHKQAFADLDAPLPELSKCWSACTIIFYSGASRAVFDNRDHRLIELGKTRVYPTIGVHRPIYLAKEYGKLTPEEAQNAYANMLQDMSDALTKMGAPDEFIKLTMATPSEDIQLIPKEKMETLLEPTEPFFEEWVAAKCGRRTDVLADQEEHNLFNRYSQMWSDVMDMSINERLEWSEDVALVKEFGLTNAVRVKEISKKVSNWEKSLQFCEDILVRTTRNAWAKKAN